MSGSHAAAMQFAFSRIRNGCRVLDAGAGMSYLAGRLSLETHCSVLAVDMNTERLKRAWEAAGRTYEIPVAGIMLIDLPCGSFAAAAALNSLQHMIGYEPAVWVRIRQWLKKGGKLMPAARYRLHSPHYEGDRGDPLMSQDEKTITVLAKFSGFEVAEIQPLFYTESGFAMRETGSPDANAVLFELELR